MNLEVTECLSSALSGNTQALLQSFYSNRDHALSRFADMKSGVTSTHISYPLSMSDFAEDWNASQFWYNDATATSFAKRLLDGATHGTSIAVVSCPSVFVQMKNLIVITSRYSLVLVAE